MIGDKVNNINWVNIPIIATAARLLNKDLTLQNEHEYSNLATYAYPTNSGNMIII